MIDKADLLRALDWAWERAQAEGIPLRVVLRREEDAIAEVHAGGSLQSVSTGQIANTYAFGTGSTLTSVELQRMWRRLISLLDDIEEARPTITEEDKARLMRLVLRAENRKQRVVDGFVVRR